jgi:phosphohistidine phosphatase
MEQSRRKFRYPPRIPLPRHVRVAPRLPQSFSRGGAGTRPRFPHPAPPRQSSTVAKILTLVRHAKSSWSDLTLDDHDRPLNKRGKNAAPKIGAYLARQIAAGHVPAPDLLFSSTALRASSTAKIIAAQIDFDPAAIQPCPDIYHASEDELLHLIQTQIPESARHAILFGHNPGFETLATALLKSKNDRDRIPRFPTCATAILQFPVEFWALADQASATLLNFVVPRSL